MKNQKLSKKIKYIAKLHEAEQYDKRYNEQNAKTKICILVRIQYKYIIELDNIKKDSIMKVALISQTH